MTINWVKHEDTNWHHTASTMYSTDGFRVWKGRRLVIGCIYTADEWNLERLSDHHVLHTATTAKECKLVLEYAVKNGMDVNDPDRIGLLYHGVKFDGDLNIIG